MSKFVRLFHNDAARLQAVLQALLVTFLWSTSWVFIKFGLADIPALTFAGLRYTLAFFCLLPFGLQPAYLSPLRQLNRLGWFRLIGLGLLFYTLTQGAQFLGLAYLPAITVNLMLSFTAVIVTLLGMLLLKETPLLSQWGGMGLYLIGASIFFYPAAFADQQFVGLMIVIGGVVANAGSAVLGRYINRTGDLPPVTVTLVSMGVGATILLISGLVNEGWPTLTLLNWATIAWLAIINTAFAFTLWNRTMQILSALESSIINNTMMIQIPILALLFLGETVSGRELVGMILAGLGILIVQFRR